MQHCGTHADAPRHVMERDFAGARARYSHELPVDAYVGDAVCLDIKIEDWGLIKGEHLDDACERANIKPEELKGMVICLRTGMHLKFDDSKDYYHYSCGTGLDAGKWFQKYMPKCVAMDMQALDHPLHTAMGKNGPHADEPARQLGPADHRRVHREVRSRGLRRVRAGRLHRGVRHGQVHGGLRRSSSAPTSPGPGSPVTSS